MEFSSDDSRLYFSALNGRSVYQYNMKADDIAASKILIAAPAPNGDQNGGALQLGPDGRIYYICSDNRIGIIKNPNALGKSCDYQDDEIILSSGKGWNGVPNIVQSALNNDKPTIVGRKSVCSNTSHTFVASPSCNESDIYEWKLSGHGKIESAAGSNVSIRFANVGSDTLVVNKTTTCGTTRDTSVISVTEPPIVDLGESVKICGGKMIVLDTKLPAEYTHIWQDGSKNSTLKVTSAGKYWFTASSPSGCTVSDTVIIESENNSPTVKLNPSQAKICRGSIVTLDAGEGYAEYSWPDGSHEQTFTAYGGGKYWVRVTDACGNISSDTAIVEETVEELITTKDTTICKGDTIMLSASGGDYYYWENHPSVISINDSTKLAAPSSTTNYRIAATMRSGCEKEGNITVSVDESSHYFRVSSENMSGLISEKNISIPVKIFSDAKSLPLTIRNLQVWLHYDAKSLITTKTSQGILKKNIFGGQENIYLYIADLDLTQAEQIVANLDAELFLRDSPSLKVMFDSATAQSQKCITMSVEEAVVELGGCGLASREGLIVQSPVVSVAPNPAEENSYIYIRNITKGKYLLAIYNMQGEKIWMQEFSFSQSSGEKISLPLNNFSSGVYRIIAETPLGTQTVPLFIVK